MLRNGWRPRLVRAATMAAAALLAAGIAACSSSAGAPPGTSSSAPKTAGGTVTFAEPPGVAINYIFPFTSIANSSVYNENWFQFLLYRELYMFGNNGSSVAVNYAISPADAPGYSDGGKTVVIDMKGWKWSNGEAVDADDVIFFRNMLEAEKANYYGYAPGLCRTTSSRTRPPGPSR
jgi:peptide/nickel transport system substrate-binding protein